MKGIAKMTYRQSSKSIAVALVISITPISSIANATNVSHLTAVLQTQALETAVSSQAQSKNTKKKKIIIRGGSGDDKIHVSKRKSKAAASWKVKRANRAIKAQSDLLDKDAKTKEAITRNIKG